MPSPDNRESCVSVVPSSCVPYTGHISDEIKNILPQCRPNVNDILNALQTLIKTIKDSLGDNTSLDPECLDLDVLTATQKDINQAILSKLCELENQLDAINTEIDPTTIRIAMDILCLVDPTCTPQTTYSLPEILIKLVGAYCNLLTRVKNIETILNL